MKVIITDDKVKMMRNYFEHQSDIEFRFYRLVEDVDLYEKMKSRNLGTHYENAIEKKLYGWRDRDYREIIAMIDNVDDVIYINPRAEIISEIYLAQQPKSFIHHIDNLNDAHALIVKADTLKYIFIRNTFRYSFYELTQLKQVIDIDEQTQQYRLMPHIDDSIPFNNVKDICEYALDYVLTAESRKTTYHYAPYHVTLKRELSRQHNSRIVRQMAEVGNIRHIFMYTHVYNDSPKPYEKLPDVDWEGDSNRVCVHQRNQVMSRNNLSYCETFFYGHYRDVQTLVESDAFHRYYDPSKEVQMSFENLTNGLVVIKLYQFDIKEVGRKYFYFDMDKEGFQTNQQVFAFVNSKQLNINDINQEIRKVIDVHGGNYGEIHQLSAKDKIDFTPFRQYLEQL